MFDLFLEPSLSSPSSPSLLSNNSQSTVIGIDAAVYNSHLVIIVGNAWRFDNFSKKEIMVEMQIFALCRHASTICPFGGAFTISVSVTETRVNKTPSSITSGRIAREIRSMMPYFRARTIAGAKARRLLSRRSVEYPRTEVTTRTYSSISLNMNREVHGKLSPSPNCKFCLLSMYSRTSLFTFAISS